LLLDRIPVFVYGTLMSGFANYRKYIQPYPHQAVPAKAKGRLYHLPEGYPALVIAKDVDWIYGEIVFFPADCHAEVLAGLDELEEYFAPGDSRNEYERELIQVSRIDREEICSAFTYTMRGEKERYARTRGVLVSSGDWRQYIQS
jgi:gamma-glutamylcyclotransferase (GGCT)/AIG2-like uncharacterized protein YtfP